MRRFNQYALQRRRKEDPGFKGRRVEGRYRVQYLYDFMRQFIEEVDEAKEALGKEKVAELRAGIEDKKRKASAKEFAKRADGLESVVEKGSLNQTAAEKPTGCSKTAVMGGKLVLSELLKKNEGIETLIDMEIYARNIMEELKEFIDANGEDADLERITFTDKKRYIKMDEAKRVIRDVNPNLSYVDALEQTKAIIPISEGLQQLLDGGAAGDDDDDEDF